MRKIEARFSSVVPLPGILTMSVNLFPATPPVDGRQSPTALAIARGTTRISMRSAIAWSASCRCRPGAALIWSRSAAMGKF
jgi:hypothetical protein